MSVLVANELGRWYGQVVGLNELSVTVEEGITGLVGPNGAGKSTFLKLIAGEIKPSRGSIRVLGEDPFANGKLYRRVGFCPQQDALYESMSGFDFVVFLLRLSGYSKKDAALRARASLERVRMQDAMMRRNSTYSKGMRQRVRIAQAIAHEPELLVLDEPLTGLDPIGRREILELLQQLGAEGMHVLLSSHVLHEVESLTQQILLLHRGRLLAQGAVSGVRELIDRHPRRVELQAVRARELARDLLAFPDVLSVSLSGDDKVVLETQDITAFQDQLTGVVAAGQYGIRSFESIDAGLEAIFDYLVA